MKLKSLLLLSLACLWVGCQSKSTGGTGTNEMGAANNAPLKALIVDGQNNHGVWPKTTMIMKGFLEESGLFEVDIARTATTYQGPHFDESIGLDDITELLDMYPLGDKVDRPIMDKPTVDSTFAPKFENYDVVISNLGWQATAWPIATKANFEKFVDEGGGFVVIHAANNSFGDWDAYNEMIGIGGWGGRGSKSGPYVYYDDNGKLHRDTTVGQAGSHGAQQEMEMTTRAGDHPIMKGLPTKWMHAKDELYDRLRGPAVNMTVLATAYSDVDGNRPPWNQESSGTGRHEPMLMAIDYGKGRVFHSALGHMGYSMTCVGFKTTFQRGAEWAATGKVTQAIPANFPTSGVVQADN